MGVDEGRTPERDAAGPPRARRVAGAWANVSLRGKALTMVLIPLSVIVVGIGSTYFVERAQERSNHLEQDADAINDALSALQADLYAARADLVSYVMTDSAALQNEYELHAAEVSRDLAAVAAIDDDASVDDESVVGVGRLRAVSVSATRSLALMGDLDRAHARAEHTSSSAKIDEIVDVEDAVNDAGTRIEVVQDDARAFRLQATERLEGWRRLDFLVQGLALPIGLLGGVAAVVLFTSGVTKRLRKVEDNARRLSDGLPLAETPPGDDEIGRLGRELEETADLLSERQTALRESRHQLQAILDNSSAVIFMKDVDGRYLFVNRRYEELFGVQRADFVGKTDMDVLPAEVARVVRDNDIEVLGRKSPVQFEEVVPHGGEPHTYVSIKFPLFDSDDEPYAVCGMATDITERKKAEDALRDSEAAVRLAMEAAERANRAKSEFLSRMSHELRTPLNAVLGFAQLLEMDHLDAEQKESVGQIIKGGRHLLELMNEVLDISRIESGRMSLSPEAVEIAGVVKECVDLIGPAAHGRDIAITTSVPEELEEVHVRADRQRVSQVLLNLLSNAVKYNRDGGRITVTCREGESDRVRIEVADTGLGIPAAGLERLFSPFDRLGAEGTGVEGTGLGLALSKRLVETMGGVIEVDSEVGRGSTFAVEFTRMESPSENVAALRGDAAAALEDDGSAGTLLYIEDNLSNVRLVERLLKRRPGVRLVSAMQGRLGLELAREQLPDLILLDVNLPDVTGEEILRRLKGDERTTDVPVYVVSADATSSQVNRLMEWGAEGYITKPFDVRQLLTAIDESLREDRNV